VQRTAYENCAPPVGDDSLAPIPGIDLGDFLQLLTAAPGLGCVKTHTSGKCGKYNSPTRH
jgi:hypothetical protein